MEFDSDWSAPYLRKIRQAESIRVHGRVTKIIGLTIESQGPATAVGDLCFVRRLDNSEPVRAEVVGFRDDRVVLMPLDDMRGIGPGCEVISSGAPLSVGLRGFKGMPA